MHRIKMGLFAAAGMIVAASPASATTYNLELSGNSSNLAVNSFTAFGGGTQGLLGLSGLDATNAISVVQGDSVNVVVTLSGLITIPMATGQTVVDDLFAGLGFDGSDVHANSVITFYNGSTPVAYIGDAGTAGQVASGIQYGPGTTLSFDHYTDSFTINELTGTASLTSATFTYDRFNPTPAPEPATWMLTIAGMGVVGGAMRRKRAVTAMVAA
jgi:hypothetical protein